jgi:hypothetical protein
MMNARNASLTLLICVLLAGCLSSPSRTALRPDFAGQIDADDPAGFQAAREAAIQQYEESPDDEARLRLAYLLSRPDPSMQQLTRGREVLAEIEADSENAPLRDMLDRELALLMELQRAQGRVLELQAQLEALKAIETEITESQQEKPEPPK